MSGRSLTRTDYRRWCEALGRTPDESLTPATRRASLPAWMSDALIATTPAIARLQAWARDPPPVPDGAELLLRLRIVGDDAMAVRVAAVLRDHVPPPVVDFAQRQVTFLCVSHDDGVRGFCIAPIPWRHTRLIALAKVQDGLFDELIAHELAHAWSDPDPAPGEPVPRAVASETIRLVPIDDVPLNVRATVMAMRRDSQREEAHVRRLVRAWGFAGIL